MRILICHNRYQQRGGEDAVVEAETALLRANGHEVVIYSRDNDDLNRMSTTAVAFQTVWSKQTVEAMSGLMASFRPDVIHVHNTLPLISPSIYWVASKNNVPVVQTLHNYRLACLNGLYLRDGEICEACAGRLPWRGVLRRCYRESLPASMALGGMLAVHRGVGSYQNKVDCYIALTEFARGKFIEAGLPEEKIRVKPNFVASEMLNEEVDLPSRSGALFVGRLSREKGLETLTSAWENLDIPLKVVGDGPQTGLLAASPASVVEKLGLLQRDGVIKQMREAAFLVMPSEWYEGFPMVLVEAFSQGLPVVASKLGGMREVVEEGVTGLHFEAGNAADLAEKAQWMYAHPDACRQMGLNARKIYEQRYTPEKNYRFLMDIYDHVCNLKPASG